MINILLGYFMHDFIPIEQMAELDDTTVSNLRALKCKPTYGSENRFKVIDGKVFVHQNYRAMMREEVEELYYKAIIIAGNDHKLATELSQLMNSNPNLINKSKDALQRYFIRFTFKQVKIANDIIDALKLYIERNSLFSMGELSYE